MIAIVPLAEIEPAAVEALLDRAFGEDRHRRTAYRVREGLSAIPALSFAALEDGELAGTLQSWPVALAGDDGSVAALTMLGPVAVEPARQMGGIGRLLTEHAIATADALAYPPLMLVGDPEYYGRFFNFTADDTGAWRLPGPFEPHRLLARGAGVPAGPGLLVAHRDGRLYAPPRRG